MSDTDSNDQQTKPFSPGPTRFWDARPKGGRPEKFTTPEDLWNGATEYFDWVESNPLWESKATHHQGSPVDLISPKMRAMTLHGLWVFLGMGRQTWYDYCQKDGFSEVCARIDLVIRDQKFAGASAGLLNPAIIARDLGLKETIANEHTGAGGGPIKTESLTDRELARRIAFALSRGARTIASDGEEDQQ